MRYFRSMWAQPFLQKKLSDVFGFYIRSEKDGEIPKKNDQESGRSDLIGWGQSSLWGDPLTEVVYLKSEWNGDKRKYQV